MTRVIAWVAAALLLAVPAAAQQGTTELRGRVVDSQGGVLPGVTVTVRNQATGMYRETVSGTDGTFIASALIPGTYEVTAELQGFKKFSRRDLRLEVGRTATIDVVMEVGALEETVNVTAQSPLVDVTSKEIGGNIDSRELVELPTINGNFVGFVGLLPGIVPTISTESFGGDSVTVNGQDPRNNNYMLDGGNNNDDVIGQRAGTQARTPIESIQEFQVITNQFDAEYGRTAGAVINAVTKQGTNQLRGSAFLNAQDASLTAPDFFSKRNDLGKPDTSYRRWGGTVGGPIVRDKMHFFFSLERFHIDEGVSVNIPSRPDLDANAVEKTRVWNTVIRGDHQINANNTYGVRWLRESSPQFNQVIDDATLDAAREESDVDQTVVTTLNSVLANTRVNTLRMAWTRENVAFGNPCFNGNGRDQAACPPTLSFQTFDTQQSDVAQSRVNDGIQVQDTLSWFIPGRHGDHDVKFGATYEYIGARSVNQGNLNGTFSFGRSDAPFNAADPRTYPDRLSIRVGGPSNSFEKTTYFAGFAQDKWRLNNRLTLSLGVRYDLEVIPIAEEDNPLFTEAGRYPVDKNNFAPRIGFSYDINGNGDSVVRGGYGRFFDKTHFELIGGFFTDTVFTSSFTMAFPLDNFDPGPRNGQFPTDPLLVNGPVLNRDLVNQLFTPGERLRNTGPTWDNPDRVNPYTDQFSIGYQREVFANSSISADYVHARSRDLLMFLQLNPTLRATSNVDDPNIRQSSATLDAATAALQQKYPGLTPFTGAVNTPVNTGETDYDALMIQFDKRFSQGYSAKVSYTLAHSRGNTSGNGSPTSGFQVLDDMHLDLNEGPTNFDRRHNLVISGTALVPHTGGLNFSWVARALSGNPFSLVNGDIDPDRNGSISEPLPGGDYSGTGEDAFDLNGYKSERNGAYGPGFFQLDMRFGYRFTLGGNRHVNAFVDLFNLTNRTNFANPSGNLASPDFLILTDYDTSYTPRKLQIGARFDF
jgi:hypothetical protein